HGGRRRGHGRPGLVGRAAAGPGDLPGPGRHQPAAVPAHRPVRPGLRRPAERLPPAGGPGRPRHAPAPAQEAVADSRARSTAASRTSAATGLSRMSTTWNLRRFAATSSSRLAVMTMTGSPGLAFWTMRATVTPLQPGI